MAEATPSAHTRARIAKLCAEVLVRSGAAGVIPTPLDAVEAAVGIRERISIGGKGDASLPVSLRERVLGAVWFEERTLFLDTTVSLGRRRFTHAHELAHVLCPWHQAALRIDTAAQLFGRLATGIEAEANVGAAQLLFQGDRFAAEARDHERSLSTAFALAQRFGASRQAAAHHYVAGHAGAVALAIAGRWPGADGRLPVWRSVESASFLRRFGRFAPGEAGRGIATRDEGAAPYAAAIDAARRSSQPIAGRVQLRDRGGAARRFHADVFNNRHCHLVFVAELAGG
jgi:hypothetical protein